MYNYYGPQSTAVEQSSLTFNTQTSQWVPASTHAVQNSSSGVQYSQAAAGPSYSTTSLQQPSINRVPPPNPVVTFTNFYHGWKAFADGKVQAPGVTKEWAQYYADTASRAAHFFHSNPFAREADFDLPPAPPPGQPAAGTNNAFSFFPQQQPAAPTSAVAYQPQHQQQVAPAAPLTYEGYMQNCLMQCITEPQQEAMQKELQQLIQQAVVDGTLQRDWSKEPLIPLSALKTLQVANQFQSPHGNAGQAINPGLLYNGSASASMTTGKSQTSRKKRNNSTPTKDQERKKRRWDMNPGNSPPNQSYYGPVVDASESKSSKKQSYEKNLPARDSYYGPSSASSTNPAPKNKISLNTSKNKKWQKNTGFNKSDSVLSERARRFASSAAQSTSFDEDDAVAQGPIVKGTCKILEKDYLRLTSAPRPELVRPLPILEKHLDNLLAERKDESRSREYLWFCSQLKAIRQDLTVQHIRNAFTVKVYETHARIALEEGDLNEYNQCQTQLKYLYEHFENEDGEEGKKALIHQDEYVAYRLLYSVLLTQNEKYQGGSSDLLKILQSLTMMQRQHQAIKFANRIRSAVAEGNYHFFFSSFKSSDGGSHAVYLLQRLAPAMRKVALQRILGAYRPTAVPVDFVLNELAYADDKARGKKWLQSCGCVFSENGEQILCKESEFRESDLDEKKSLI